VPDYNLTLDMS